MGLASRVVPESLRVLGFPSTLHMGGRVTPHNSGSCSVLVLCFRCVGGFGWRYALCKTSIVQDAAFRSCVIRVGSAGYACARGFIHGSGPTGATWVFLGVFGCATIHHHLQTLPSGAKRTS